MAVKLDEVWQNQFRIPVGVPDNHPSNTYATVKVNGKIVATLYNSGGAVTSNVDYGRVSRLPSMTEAETLTGPALAQKRAEEIARKLGGTVEKATTAQSQIQWQNRAPMEWTYDYEALETARKQRDASTAARIAAGDALRARALMEAQLLGQES